MNPDNSKKKTVINLTFSLTHRIIFEVLAENLRSDPTLGAGNPGPSAETVAPHCELLTQAEV